MMLQAAMERSIPIRATFAEPSESLANRSHSSETSVSSFSRPEMARIIFTKI